MIIIDVYSQPLYRLSTVRFRKLVMEAIEHEREKLELFLGRWEGRGTIHSNPWGGAGPTQTAWWFHWDEPRLFLLCDCREERSDGSVFSAHGVLGIDPVMRDPLWWIFDSYGYPPMDPARGSWDEQTLHLVKTTARGTGRTSFSRRKDCLECVVESRGIDEANFVRVMSGSFCRTGD
ncbi:hypothetical protein AF71_00027350 [Rhizobium sp. 57MFTsu3.2]|nr:hypothetical protein [Rhizobium sp. 57MFTsu3.2]